MARIAAALLVLLLAFPAAADEAWRVGPAPSDHPDLKAARVTNEDGHTMYVWLLTRDDSHERQLFGELHLAPGTAFAGTMPVYRIDNAKPVDTAEIRDAGNARDALWGHVGERVAFWLIAPVPAVAAAHRAALEPWLKGQQLTISFRTADGTEQTTRFTLAGSAAAIRDAAGIAQN